MLTLAMSIIRIWQSWAEIEHYSIAYFDTLLHSKQFSAKILLWAGLMCTVLIPGHLISLCSAYESTLNERSALQHFRYDNTVELHNRTGHRFYLKHTTCNISIYRRFQSLNNRYSEMLYCPISKWNHVQFLPQTATYALREIF